MRHFLLFILLLLALSGTVAYGRTVPHQAAPASAVDYLNRGLARHSKDDYDGAIADYTKAIEINPRYAEAYYACGNARFGKKDYDGAIADYTKAIEINPGYAEAYYGRGHTRFATSDFDGAIADLTKAIAIKPGLAKPYYSRGSARYAKGDRDGAVADYTKAIEINPEFAEAYAFRGLTKLQQGKDAEAQKDVDTAIRLNGSLKSMVEKLSNSIRQERQPRESGRSATPSSSQQDLTTLEYNVYYICNGERVLVTRCRGDSDQSGSPPTQPANDYCQVYYPDRPKRGGFDASAVELRSDLIKKLRACSRGKRTVP